MVLLGSGRGGGAGLRLGGWRGSVSLQAGWHYSLCSRCGQLGAPFLPPWAPARPLPLCTLGPRCLQVAHLGNISSMYRAHPAPTPELRAACASSLVDMLVAMQHSRAVLVKLADRLHDMRTLAALPPATRNRMAQVRAGRRLRWAAVAVVCGVQPPCWLPACLPLASDHCAPDPC